MTEMNSISLMNQMRVMTAQAQGSSVEFNAIQMPFSDVFRRAINDVNELQLTADDLKARFEMGDSNVAVSEVMVATQKSNIAFEAILRVRNKVVQAYQDIMNMPI